LPKSNFGGNSICLWEWVNGTEKEKRNFWTENVSN
jgi:hypothetical protein